MKKKQTSNIGFGVRRSLIGLCLIAALPASALAQNVDIVRVLPYGAVVSSTSKENGHVLKTTGGSLISLTVTSDSDQYILVINSATVPANGAVALLCPPIHVGAATTTMVNFPNPLRASTGISVCNSNANSFTKTIGAGDCIFTGQVQ
jgi:hypothetical protein